jgi:S1-C subfamily serine protease
MFFRRRHSTSWIVLYFCLLLPHLATAQTAADVARNVLPSVVLISTADRNGQPLAIGSGFFVGSGQIVTNLHVVAGAQRAIVKLKGTDRQFVIDGSLGTDEAHDLAMIQVTAIERPSLAISSDSNLQIGDQIYVAGNPEGLEGIFSQGIISAIRELPAGRIIQIAAPISPGSSGGPVLNQQGQVIGVAFATLRDGQNLNFALPSSHVRVLMQKTQGLRPLAVLENGSNAQTRILERAKGSVSAVNFKWRFSDHHPDYAFVLRNLGDDGVKNIAYLLMVRQ